MVSQWRTLHASLRCLRCHVNVRSGSPRNSGTFSLYSPKNVSTGTMSRLLPSDLCQKGSKWPTFQTVSQWSPLHCPPRAHVSHDCLTVRSGSRSQSCSKWGNCPTASQIRYFWQPERIKCTITLYIPIWNDDQMSEIRASTFIAFLTLSRDVCKMKLYRWITQLLLLLLPRNRAPLDLWSNSPL